LRLSQNRNKRNNRFITANGETLCLAEWTERLNCSAATIVKRLSYGWTEQDAVTIPVRKQKKMSNNQ
jgi:hypothetical protein